MSYGFKSINGQSFVQIDSDTPRLCWIESGSYSSASGYKAFVTFAAPITTQEPPCIFIRPTTTSATELYRTLTFTGSTGNWTGFTVESANVTFFPSGKWFSAVFASKSKADYGMRLFGSDGAVVYDSEAPAVIVTKLSGEWAYQGTVRMDIGVAAYYRTNGVAAEDEYIMINPFSRYLLSPAPNGSSCGLRLNYAGGFTEIYAQNTSNWTDIGYIAAVFARLNL